MTAMTRSFGRRLVSRLLSRLRTVGALVVYFTRRERVFLAPLLLVLLVASLLLLATGGLSYVAPFVYSLF
jgi:Family of unknown function (DUF5989)